ncbi:MAG: AtpZ/AtpI family protein [Desulfuromonadaceae bacterium]|nr:AtpZ/AtpI family protein [Desulfuromonadaceae bacterium]
MGEDRRQLVRSLGMVSSIGVCMVASTVIGLAMGYYLDKWLDTSPWCTLIFLVFGIVSGFRNIYILTRRELKRQQEQNHRDKGNGDGSKRED